VIGRVQLAAYRDACVPLHDAFVNFISAYPMEVAESLDREGRARPASDALSRSKQMHDLFYRRRALSATGVSPASAALRSARVLDVLSSTPARPVRRAPCVHAHLGRLATNPGEKCGPVPADRAEGGAPTSDRSAGST